MKMEIIESDKGILSSCTMEETETVQTASDFLDLLMSCPTDTIVIRRRNITGEFFNLKTGMAGECLQKISNYRKRLIILGDYQDVQSKALKDFIFESNKTGHVVFIDDLEKAVELLR